jgi:hypothetical protein
VWHSEAFSEKPNYSFCADIIGNVPAFAFIAHPFSLPRVVNGSLSAAIFGSRMSQSNREEPLPDVGVAHRLGSVGVWRGGGRGGLSVASPFVRRLARHLSVGFLSANARAPRQLIYSTKYWSFSSQT